MGQQPAASASAHHRLNSVHLPNILVRYGEFISARSGLSKLRPTGHIQSPVIVNKVLLEHSYHHLFPYYLWLLRSATAELSSYDRDRGVCRVKNIYTLTTANVLPTPALNPRSPCVVGGPAAAASLGAELGPIGRAEQNLPLTCRGAAQAPNLSESPFSLP